MRLRIRALASLLFLAASFQIPAQVSSAGTIAGLVADSSGAMIPQTAISAVLLQTNAQWKTTTDETGNYIFPNLPVGTYTLTAEKIGFGKQQVNSIVLNAGDHLRTNFTLQPGTVSSTVEVTSNALNVDTESGNVGNVITGATIEAMPLVTRNFIELVQLAPGISSDIGSEPGFGSNAGLYASSNGVRNTSNNWTIDGVPDEDVYYGNNAIVPDIDALAEFRMDRGNYSSEQGRTAGATINAILKSGSNAFHGTAFEFMRNGALNANNFFNNLEGISRPNEHYNNWGYTVGGPIKKDKLFFFWSEEWRRIIEPNGTSLALVPTDDEIAGKFSDYATLGLTEPTVPSSLASNVNCVAGQPFPNDQIPTTLLNTNAVNLIKYYYPRAQTYNSETGSNYPSSAPTRTSVREELVRLDYNISDKWKAYAHYIQDQNHIDSPYSLWNDEALPNVGASTEFEPIQSLGINLNGTITPNLVNEIQFGLSHNIARISESSELSRTVGGINIPYYFSNHTNTGNRIPVLSFSHYSSISTDWPFLNGYFYHKLDDNLSWHKGMHNFKFGLLVIQQGKNENNSNSYTNGGFSWYGTKTGNDLADMLIGFADTYSETKENPMQHLRYWDTEAYAQDQWQLHRLSLTYGLRYTYYGPETDLNNLNSNFLTQNYSSALAPTVNSDGTLSNIAASQITDGVYLPTNGIIVAGSNSPYGNAVFSVSKLNLSPRFGFSYDVFGNGKTALRGGYGMYFDRTAPYQLSGKDNPPFNASVTLYNVGVDDPENGTNEYSTASAVAFKPKYSNPYNQQYSLGIQQQIFKNGILTVEYVGTKETHMLYERQLNQNQPSAAVAAGTVNVNQLRPYAGYNSIAQFNPGASSRYNGLQTSFREQLGRNFTLDLSYTYSKVLTDASTDSSSPQDSYNLRADWGPATFDKPHMLIIDYVWQLPSLASSRNALLRGALGGWEWSGILNASSGEPITASLDVYENSGVVDSTQRPNQSGKVHTHSGRNNWLNYDAFSVPTQGTFGNSPVGMARLPHTTQFDSSISKDFHVHSQLHAQFKLQAINAINHTLFNGVNTTYYSGSTTFGHITSATAPRTVQAGLHFTF
jgi:hypothetical protein